MPRQPKHHKDEYGQSKFDTIPPQLMPNLSARDYVDVLKEARWNNDYKNEMMKEYLGTSSINDIVFADHKCSLASALVLRYVLPEFFKSKNLTIDRIAGVESDGDYPAAYSAIEIAPGKMENRLIYGDYFVANGDQRYIVHLEEAYPDAFRFKIASAKNTVPDANTLSEEMIKYGEANNFLKGQKIDPNCNFVKFNRKFTWDDLILSDKIKGEIQMNLKNLIEYREIYKKNGLQVKRGLILAGEPGCHAKGTKILMYDGSVKNVEDVRLDDLLMGPDSEPRRVLNLARGSETMYKILPNSGEEFTVNENHILHLRYSGRKSHKQKLYNITVKDFLRLNNSEREHLKLTRTPVHFEKKSLSIDPYILGLWLGDGASKTTELSTIDEEIFNAWCNYGLKLDLHPRVSFDKRSKNLKIINLVTHKKGGTLNIFRDKLRSLNLLHNKHIPFEYLTSSNSDRLNLLAGLLDTDGCLDKEAKCFDITTVSKRLADDYMFLARSLGFNVHMIKRFKRCQTGNGNWYYVLTISGNCSIIPTKVKRKQCTERKQIKNVLITGFKVQKLGIDDYYGFALSGDHLYLTGDFMIHHNTGKTVLAKILCNQIDWTFVWVTSKNLENAKRVAQIVELCRDLSPAVLFLEDLDLFGGSRESNNNPMLLGELLNQLDGVEENTDIIVIGSTNNKDVLEKALVARPGRFDKVIDFPLPAYAERLKMLKVFSNGLIGDDLPYLEKIAREYKKKTGAQIRELVNMAIIHAVDEKSYGDDKQLIIKEEHFTKAMKAVEGKDFKSITGFSPGGSSKLGSRFDDYDD